MTEGERVYVAAAFRVTACIANSLSLSLLRSQLPRQREPKGRATPRVPRPIRRCGTFVPRQNDLFLTFRRVRGVAKRGSRGRGPWSCPALSKLAALFLPLFGAQKAASPNACRFPNGPQRRGNHKPTQTPKRSPTPFQVQNSASVGIGK